MIDFPANRPGNVFFLSGSIGGRVGRAEETILPLYQGPLSWLAWKGLIEHQNPNAEGTWVAQWLSVCLQPRS